MTKKSLKKQKNQLDSYIKYSSLAFQMGGIIAFFCWLGVWLDDFFTTAQAWLTIIFTLFGVFGSLYVVFSQLLKKKDE